MGVNSRRSRQVQTRDDVYLEIHLPNVTHRFGPLNPDPLGFTISHNSRTESQGLNGKYILFWAKDPDWNPIHCSGLLGIY